MPDVSFVGLLIVALVAFLAPLLLGLSPARCLPSVVIEIVLGIVIGPSVGNYFTVDLPVLKGMSHALADLFGLRLPVSGKKQAH